MSSAKNNREVRNTSSSESHTPMKNSSTSFKRRSTNTSQNMKSGKEDNQLKFVHVVKPNDEELNFRKTKSNTGESKDKNIIMIGSDITTNNEQLLESIIQSRCLTKDQE